METILSITDGIFEVANTYGHFEGWVIKTTLQEIKFGVSNGQSCCESYGTLITNDEITSFIGTELISITQVDTALNNKKIDELEYLDSGGCIFLNFETSVGLLQFVVYNSHNGYYGHEAVLISKQLNISEVL